MAQTLAAVWPQSGHTCAPHAGGRRAEVQQLGLCRTLSTSARACGPRPPLAGPPSLQVQIIRIQLRVPEFGWTTQKVFHLLNFLVSGLRCAVFAFRSEVQDLPYTLFQAVLLDLPGGCCHLAAAN